MKLEPGGKLTFAEGIRTEGGYVIFRKGDKVTIREVCKIEGRWSNFFGYDSYYIPEQITGVKLEEEQGHWSLDCFEETKQTKKV